MAGTTTNFAIPYPSVTDYVTDGATAMRSIAEQVDAVLFTGSSSGNLLINGAMQVAQRGTSTASITGTNYYTADRFQFLINTLGTWTQTIENDAPTGSGFRKSIKNLCTVIDTPAAGDYCITEQVIEGQNLQAIRKGTASAQSVVLSFWVKANKTGTYICQLRDDDNSRSVSKSYTITASATWQYVSIVFPADTTGVFDNDANGSLRVRWWLGAGSTFSSGTLNTTWQTEVQANVAVGQVNLADTLNNYWQMTGAQLTVASIATPFEFKSFADDLLDCQRYFQASRYSNMPPSGYSATGASFLTAMSNFASLCLATGTLFTVPMRATPSITMWSTGGTLNRTNVVGIGDYVISTPEATERGIHRVGNTGMSANMTGEFLWQALAEL